MKRTIDTAVWAGRLATTVLLTLAMLAGLTVTASCAADGPEVESVATPAEVSRHNLAAGVKYECAPAPNYWGWKNPQHGDHGQLTDGKIIETWSTEGGLFYTLPSSMGWNRMPPMVVFDLGETRTITGIGLHTILSPYGPWWPKSVTVLVSDDNENFYLAGPELTPAHDQLEPPVTDELVQQAIDRVMCQEPPTLWNRYDGLNATGRYVALFMTKPPDTGTIVVDEIEIYGHTEAASVGERPEQAFTEGTGGVLSYKLFDAISERLWRDIEALRQKITTSSIDSSERDDLLSQVAALDVRRQAMPVPLTAGFRAVLPINPLHAEVFAVHAALWRAEGAPELRLWQTHHLDPLAPLHQPSDETPKLEITMAQNAVRSDVLNISDARDDLAPVVLELHDLPAEHLEVCEVPFVDTKDFEPAAAALMPTMTVLGQHRIVVTPGMTCQIWLRCSSKGLAAGQYNGSIHLTSGDWSADVPVSIEVLPVQMPDKFSVYIGGWEYPWAGQYQVTEQNLAQFLAVLKEYGVNTTWAGNPFPYGKYDDEGNLTETPSRKMADEWLERWPDAAMYCPTLWILDRPRHQKGRAALQDLAKKDEAWAKDWSAYIQSKGLEPERVAMLIQDEPTTEGELKIILDTGRAIKKGEPRFKIWNDIHYPDPLNAPPVLNDVMREACDIQCFSTQHFLAAPDETLQFMKQQSREGLQWWSYTGGGSHRLTDPYVAWRLRFWLSYDLGLTGAHFWAFGDGNGGFSWNEYFNTGPTRSPLYLAPDGITPGKAMEAMREGAQDYELLKMLERQGGEAAVRALRRDVQRVLAVHTDELWLWKAPKDRSLADEVRIQVLRQLAEVSRQ